MEKEGRLLTVKTIRLGNYTNISLFGQATNRPKDTKIANIGALYTK